MHRLFRLAIMVLALLAALMSCSLLDDTVINSRIDSFISSLNGANRSSVYQNFSPNASMIVAITSAVFWDGAYPYGNALYSLSSRSGVSDASGGMKEVTANFSSGGFTNDPVVFILEQVSGLWLIREFDQNGSVVVNGVSPNKTTHSLHIK
jgi:hypothetical protein